MNRKMDQNAFAEACKKVGLDIDATVNSRPASGIVIKDAKGNKYTVNGDMQIEHIPEIKGAMLKRTKNNLVRRGKVLAARKMIKRIKHKG